MPEVSRVLGNREKFDFRRLLLPRTAERGAASPTSWRCARPRRISSPASPSARAPSSRCRMAATIAAPSASSLMAAGTAARCRPGWSSSGSRRWSARAFSEVVLTGVDVTSYGPDLPGAPTLGPAGRAHPAPRARPAAAAPLLARLHRDGRAAVRARRRRAALHAAPPYELSGRRRPDPEADEAPPQPRAGGRDGGAAEGGAAGDRDRRRPHRRLPDRERRRRTKTRCA